MRELKLIQHVPREPSPAGSEKTWTWSSWGFSRTRVSFLTTFRLIRSQGWCVSARESDGHPLMSLPNTVVFRGLAVCHGLWGIRLCAPENSMPPFDVTTRMPLYFVVLLSMWELGSCKSASNDHTSGSIYVILFCVVGTHGLLWDSVAEDVNMPKYTFTIDK